MGVVKTSDAILVLIVSILLLNGCTSTSSGNPTANGQKETVAPAEINASQPPPSEPPKTETPATPKPTEPKATQKFLSYANQTYGIKIKYPENWKIDENVSSTIVSFVSNLEGPSDIFAENVGVSQEDLLGANITLENYTDSLTRTLRRMFNDFTLLDSSPTTLDNQPARKLIFTASQGQYKLKFQFVYAMKDQKAYLVLYTAEASQFQNNLGTVQKMLDSFDFTSEKYLLYENAAHKIKLHYPRSWSRRENFMSVPASFFSPPENSSDIFSENVGVLFEDLSGKNISLENYTNASITVLERVITDIKIVESSPATLAGQPAHKLVITGVQGKFSIKWLYVYAIKDEKAYLIVYTSESDRYSRYLDTVQKIIDSFQFT